MPRCNDCNKFCAIDDSNDPEVNIDVDDDGQVTGTVEISNACADCGSEVRTASLDVTVDPEQIEDDGEQSISTWLSTLDDETRKEVTFEVEEDGAERTQRSEGKGRGLTTYYGAKIDFVVTATWDEAGKEQEKKFRGEWSDDVQASSMDEV